MTEHTSFKFHITVHGENSLRRASDLMVGIVDDIHQRDKQVSAVYYFESYRSADYKEQHNGENRE